MSCAHIQHRSNDKKKRQKKNEAKSNSSSRSSTSEFGRGKANGGGGGGEGEKEDEEGERDETRLPSARTHLGKGQEGAAQERHDVRAGHARLVETVKDAEPHPAQEASENNILNGQSTVPQWQCLSFVMNLCTPQQKAAMNAKAPVHLSPSRMSL